MESLLGIVFLLGFVGLLALVAMGTGRLVDPIIDRADRWISRRFSKRP